MLRHIIQQNDLISLISMVAALWAVLIGLWAVNDARKERAALHDLSVNGEGALLATSHIRGAVFRVLIAATMFAASLITACMPVIPIDGPCAMPTGVLELLASRKIVRLVTCLILVVWTVWDVVDRRRLLDALRCRNQHTSL